MHQSTLLLRQIHPSFIQNSAVSSQAFEITSVVFNPTPKDDGKLSVYNGDKFSAKEAFDHFTKNYSSIGVLAVTMLEVQNAGLDAAEDNLPFDGHAYIDYTKITSNGQRKSKAKILKKHATNRGWLHKINP
ncbi:MAG: hypothetical protein KA734_01070 [Fluviicola sp.]|nr:hypothetical protein [Fluviicola sp.]MBP6074253.1 hypothetical protein [Flavobacterium sp.]